MSSVALIYFLGTFSFTSVLSTFHGTNVINKQDLIQTSALKPFPACAKDVFHGLIFEEVRLVGPIIVLSIFIISGCDNFDPNTQVPQAENTQFSHDFGAIYAGIPARHEFEFKNPTANILIIDPRTGVRTSCGCTTPDVSPLEIQPKGVALVSLDIDTSGKKGPFSEHAQLTWTSKNGESVSQRFRVSGHVNSPFKLSKDSLNFSREEVVSGEVKTVVVESKLAIDWNSFQCECSHPAITIKVSNGRNPLSRNVEVGIRSDSVSGPVSTRMHLKALPQSKNSFLHGSIYVSVANLALPRIVPKLVRLKRGQNDLTTCVGEFFVRGIMDLEDNVPEITIKTEEPESQCSLIDVVKLGNTAYRVSFSFRPRTADRGDRQFIPLHVSVNGERLEILKASVPKVVE